MSSHGITHWVVNNIMISKEGHYVSIMVELIGIRVLSRVNNQELMITSCM